MWILSSILLGHHNEVKGMCAPTDDLIVSASRDLTVRTWKRQSNNTFTEDKVFLGHTNYVNSVAFIPASETNPQGLIVSGGSDWLINVWDPEDASGPIYTLTGHSDNVCSLFADADGHIVSGSWDKTAKVWRDGQIAYTLDGHTGPVDSVIELDKHDIVVTASAGNSIAMWRQGIRIKTITNQEACVKALAPLSGTGFVSSGTKGTLIVWNYDGDPIQELDGRTSFVYSLTTLPTGEILSSGEDGAVRISQDGNAEHIPHPQGTLWSLATLPCGDVASGCSDGAIRIFTQSATRSAAPQTSYAFTISCIVTGIRRRHPFVELVRESIPEVENNTDNPTWAEAYDWLSEEALPMLAKSETLLRRLQKQHIDLDESSTSSASIICQILNGPRSYSGLDLVDVIVWLKNLACTLLFDIYLFSNFKPVWRYRPRASRFSVGVAHLEDISTHQRTFRPLIKHGGTLFSEWRYKKQDDQVYPVAVFHQEARQPQRRDHMRMDAETTQACFEAAVPEVLAENIAAIVQNCADLSGDELQQKFNKTRTRLIGRDRLFPGVLVRAADLGKANHHGHPDMVALDISDVLKKINYNYLGYWQTYVHNHFHRIWNENRQRFQALENRVSVDMSKRRRTGGSRWSL